jgi:phosphoribosylglycinamide formyltransferase-1
MTATSPTAEPRRVVALASGGGSTLQALLDAAADPAYGVRVVAVGSDREGTGAVERARASGVATFVLPLGADREDWDAELAEVVAQHEPDLVVLAGFMRLVGRSFLGRWGGRVVNSHPALLPSFPGMHAARDALGYGVKVTGCTLFVVDDGVDTGPIVDQRVVPVEDGDDETALHDRIKAAERTMLVEMVGRMLREGFTVRGRKVSIP